MTLLMVFVLNLDETIPRQENLLIGVECQNGKTKFLKLLFFFTSKKANELYLSLNIPTLIWHTLNC